MTKGNRRKMSKGKLFEFAVLYHPKPTKEEVESGDHPKSVMLTEVQRVLAGSQDEVAMLAARSVPEAYISKLENVEVVVRPF
jgi:hypothetical protein